ncbi:MAG TPA: sigma-70 family RNA polymerase sigma factor [Anaerolineales bacterium]|nr:sigma-70 family RNA polymerase sigma factor [Anaerolineales bacterium]HRQ92131.1 sigma-70 family RNA polymerase sigma factor [Anaerolineales bacterium]
MSFQSHPDDDSIEQPVLFEDNPLEELSNHSSPGGFMPDELQDIERLRWHYINDEDADDDSLAALGTTEPDADAAEAYELPADEVIDTVGLYLKEMSAVPLLNMEQEVSLAKRMEAAKKAISQLKKLPAKDGRRAALEAVVEDGRQARDHLIRANTRLVVSIAKKYMSRGVPFLDLIQEGNLGLMKAVSKFDHRRGFRFSTYATWWIRQTITRAIADQGRTIRVPVHMIDRIRLLYKTAHQLEQKNGQPPSLDELAKEMKEDVGKIDWMLRVSWLPLSLESPVGDEEDSELGMFVEDENSPSPSQTAYKNMMEQKVHEVLGTLSPREARILRLRFGLENGRYYTLEEVGEKFGLTRERIRQIEGKALRRLRHPLRARQLRDYVQGS